MNDVLAPANLRTFVVSCRGFKERHAHIEKIFLRLDIQFEYIFEFDVEDLKPSDWDGYDHALPSKSFSCLRKHIFAQELLLKSNAEYALIVEDDAVLVDSFREDLRAIIHSIKTLNLKNFLIFLGGADNRLDSRFFDAYRNDLIEASITTAEAYLVDRDSCSKRLAWMATNKVEKPADHFLANIDSLLNISQFRPSYPLASQGSITGQFRTTLDANRSKHSRLFLRVKFLKNRLVKHVVPRAIWRLFK